MRHILIIAFVLGLCLTGYGQLHSDRNKVVYTTQNFVNAYFSGNLKKTMRYSSEQSRNTLLKYESYLMMGEPDDFKLEVDSVKVKGDSATVIFRRIYYRSPKSKVGFLRLIKQDKKWYIDLPRDIKREEEIRILELDEY